MSDESDWQPTMELRWMLSPTPGERPELQQLWVRPNEYDPGDQVEEWRAVPFVEQRVR